MTVTETPDNASGTSHQLVLEASGVTMRFGASPPSTTSA